MKDQNQPYSVRLDPQTRAALDKLARQSGRPGPQVIRRLILTAANNPQVLQALGTMPGREPQPMHA